MILIIRIWLIKLLAGKMGIALNIISTDIRPQSSGQNFYADNVINPYTKAKEAVENLERMMRDVDRVAEINIKQRENLQDNG